MALEPDGYAPATDLGFLLHKNAGRLHTVEIAAGRAYVFYPQACEDRRTIALLLDVDAIQLARGGNPNRRESGLLDQYVNDRAYAASSFMSVAVGNAFRTALGGGRSKERPELVEAGCLWSRALR